MDSLGSRAAKALAPLPPALGIWAVGWSRTVLGTQQEKRPVAGSEQHHSRALRKRNGKTQREGCGTDGCLLSRARSQT